MIAQYTVKRNGKWYHVGDEIIEIESEEIKEVEDFDEAEMAEEVTTSFSYKKTDINRMSTADLRKLAVENGVPSAEQMTGTELKTYLINMFDL
jgi:hypothetical protein|nr:MAG TPA_asm: Rho termination factor, N-terminal domain [Caudoviricetes sp.]